jgi:hypothetical protein
MIQSSSDIGAFYQLVYDGARTTTGANRGRMADTSLWPVLVGGLLTGLFALGGIGVGLVGASRQDAAQERRDTRKRRADKFEELVAAVYEFDHWLDAIRQRDAFGHGSVPETASPFAKVQSISAVYFPQFSGLVGELDQATTPYRVWIHSVEQKRVLGEDIAQVSAGFADAFLPYAQTRAALIDALKKFAHDEFQ